MLWCPGFCWVFPDQLITYCLARPLEFRPRDEARTDAPIRVAGWYDDPHSRLLYADTV